MAAKSVRETLFGAEENSAAKLDPEKRSRFQRIAARMYHTPQLSAREVAMPALARAGREIGEKINGNYRMYFFISVLRIDMVYVTIILSLISIYDVLNNPLMGIVYDRTRTRWGKARPFVALAPLLYFASTALLACGRLFFNNDVTDDPRKILFVFAVLFLQETFSTIYTIPNDNYLTLMSPCPQDRISVGLWQTYAYKWTGDFLVAGLLMPLLDLARSGILPISSGMVFAGFGIIAAVVGTSGSMLMAINCRERIILQPKPAAATKTVFYILKNKYAMRNFCADFVVNWWNKGGLNWDVITQLEIFGGVVRTVPWYLPRQVMQFVSLSLIEPFKRMFGGSYRKTVIFMRLWDMILCSVPAILGLSPKIIGSWWKAGIAFAVFDGLCVSNDAPSNVLQGELDRQVGDYTEYITGERPDGTIGLLTGLIGKVTEPLKALWTILVLKWANYDPNIAADRPWSQALVRANSAMYSKVFLLYNIANILPDIIKMVPLFFYDLEGKKLEDMYIALNERRAMIAKESAMSEEMEAMLGMLAEEDGAETKA